MQRHDERDAPPQKDGQQTNRPRKPEHRRRELHMHHVDIQATQSPDSGNDSPNIPLVRNANGALSIDPRPLVRCDDQRLEPDEAQMKREPARVIGHPVPRRVEVTTNQSDPRPAHWATLNCLGASPASRTGCGDELTPEGRGRTDRSVPYGDPDPI